MIEKNWLSTPILEKTKSTPHDVETINHTKTMQKTFDRSKKKKQKTKHTPIGIWSAPFSLSMVLHDCDWSNRYRLIIQALKVINNIIRTIASNEPKVKKMLRIKTKISYSKA